MIRLDRRFPVIDLYGPVVQGEGELIGVPTMFVRFGGCDYFCAWCDSLYAVDPEQVRTNATKMTAQEIVNELGEFRAFCKWVTLSGGNPVLHDLGPLVNLLHQANYLVAIETQGSVYRPWLNWCDVVTVSPKPPSSKMTTNWEKLAEVVKVKNANLKVVVFNDEDYAYARRVRREFPDVPMTLQVGNAVGEDSTKELLAKLKWLTEKALQDPIMGNVKVLPQLHVLLYANERRR